MKGSVADDETAAVAGGISLLSLFACFLGDLQPECKSRRYAANDCAGGAVINVSHARPLRAYSTKGPPTRQEDSLTGVETFIVKVWSGLSAHSQTQAVNPRRFGGGPVS